MRGAVERASTATPHRRRPQNTKQEALYHLSSHVTDELWFNRLCKVAGFAERDSDFLDCHEVAQVASDMLEEDGLLASVFVGIIGVRCRLVLRYSGRHPFCNRSAYKDSLDRLVSFAGTQRYAGHNLISFMPTRHSGLYTYGHNPRRMSR